MVHDAILDTQDVATTGMLDDVAKRIQLDHIKLNECVRNNETLVQIRKEADAARDLGVFGTPTFMLGKTRSRGAEGTLIEGALSLEALEARINDLLSQTGTSQPK